MSSLALALVDIPCRPSKSSQCCRETSMSQPRQPSNSHATETILGRNVLTPLCSSIECKASSCAVNALGNAEMWWPLRVSVASRRNTDLKAESHIKGRDLVQFHGVRISRLFLPPTFSCFSAVFYPTSKVVEVSPLHIIDIFIREW